MAFKTAGGGGGKGFHVAHTASEGMAAFEQAASEGERFFANGDVYLERYLEDPRHVEVQILADAHGNVVHLGERDCSIQRRHQKLVEESPGPTVTPELRERHLRERASRPRAPSATGAPAPSSSCWSASDFYFLEMNTRLQVEHPVTEMVTGIDLVREQIRVAEGQPLSFSQEDVVFRGHAIECRINAEAAHLGFVPLPGTIARYEEPGGPGVRVDSGVRAGWTVPPFYDSLLAKLIVWDETREAATARMLRGLAEFRIEGLATLVPFHRSLLASGEWARGETAANLLGDPAWLTQTAAAN